MLLHNKRSVVGYLAIIVAVVTAIVTYNAYNTRHNDFKRTHKSLAQAISDLKYCRPEHYSKQDWESVIDWTINLHGNCDTIRGGLTIAQRVELVERIQSNTQSCEILIKYIWNYYHKNTQYGEIYYNKHNPL